MAVFTIALRSQTEQTRLNLRRWEEVLNDPQLRRIEGRVETDRHGRVILTLPQLPHHGRLMCKVGSLLEVHAPSGQVITVCPISTADGVRAVDVGWASDEKWEEIANLDFFLRAPEICVEVISPSNSEEEIQEKMALYFDAGAREVWICGIFGKMSFYAAGPRLIELSELCPEFPQEV